MRIAIINSTCGIGSTGKMCLAISNILKSNGIDNRIFFTQEKSNYNYSVKYSWKIYKKIQSLKSRILGNWGFNSFFSTHILISKLKKYKPDIINLHNIHSHDCNLQTLLSYIKKARIKVVWTFHDCWAFTGYCTHFIFQNCMKWEKKCYGCEQVRKYSWFFDRSTSNYNKKKKSIFGIDLTVVTPSLWLSSLVKRSFFSDKRILTINNGIDLSIFKPSSSSFRQNHGITTEQFMILGVSFIWSYYKGFDVFLRLAKELPKNFKIVLVGINKKMASKMPPDVICIERTNNQHELAEIYSCADLLVNPTREENYPTIHLESLACGTPVLCFDTGGCKEMISDTCGCAVPVDDYNMLKKMLINICESHKFSRKDCLIQARSFDENVAFKKYLSLFNSIATRG